MESIRIIERPNALDEFVFIDAENLSLEERFMQYEISENDFIKIEKLIVEFKENVFCGRDELVEIERLLKGLQKEDASVISTYYCEKKIIQTKALIAEAIKAGVKNFYLAKNTPSFVANGVGISFEEGQRPAVARSYEWWAKMAENYAPEYGSRLGSRLEYGAFLGVLIKTLVAKGYSIAQAWAVVGGDSCELGRYSNSVRDMYLYCFEPTGSRNVCGFCDLANVRKILSDDTEAGGFWLAGGCYNDDSSDYPLGELVHYSSDECDEMYYSSGWIVLS